MLSSFSSRGSEFFCFAVYFYPGHLPAPAPATATRESRPATFRHTPVYPHWLSTEFTLNHPLLASANNNRHHTIPRGPCSRKLRVFLTYCPYISAVSTFLYIRYTREFRDCLLGISPSGNDIS